MHGRWSRCCWRPVAASRLRASHRALIKEESKLWKPVHDHTRAVPVIPGEINEYAFALQTSHIFLPGHRMVLQIKAASPQPPNYTSATTIGFNPSPWTTCYKIYHDEEHPSHLVLPVIPETKPQQLQYISGEVQITHCQQEYPGRLIL